MKTILITGATSGIGLATAKHFKQHGHNVLITGRDATRLKAAADKTGAIPLLCDSTSIEQVQSMAKGLRDDGVFLDALVLNAGVFFPQSFESENVENTQLTLMTNFTGPFFTLQALLPQLKNPASVVFVSSIAVNKAHPGCAVYAASKAAFEAAANVMNIELADKGVRVNSIRPGVTETEIQQKAGITSEQMEGLKESLTALPIGRILQPEDIVAGIDYLVSDMAIAARAMQLTIDGGFSL